MSRPMPNATERLCAADEPLQPEAPAEPSAETWPHQIGWGRTALRRRFGPDLADDISQEAYVRLAERP